MNLLNYKHVKLLALLAALALVLAACGGGEPTATPETAVEATETAEVADSGVTGLCANEYQPLMEGSTWTYEVTDADSTETYTTTVSELSADGFTFTHEFENTTVTQVWVCTPEGLSALEYGDGPEASIVGSGFSADIETLAVTGISFPKELAPGTTWEQTYDVQGNISMGGGVEGTASGTVRHTFTAIGEETVTVPGGSFTAMRVEGTNVISFVGIVSGIVIPIEIEGTTVIWWARDVGMVRSESALDAEGGAPFVGTVQLMSYSLP
ncbi:MAG TPA: hypothetical protein PLC52_05395 [Anaerolineales bacterium]|nr:hypothetical protein [Anaerolineales bacterium]HRQ92283.1 hypothetical protein [Anaerolineales bacterium]